MVCLSIWIPNSLFYCNIPWAARQQPCQGPDLSAIQFHQQLKFFLLSGRSSKKTVLSDEGLAITGILPNAAGPMKDGA